jgi:hypothetical protein
MNLSNGRSIVVFTAYALGSMLLATELLAQTFSEQGATILGDVNYNSRSASLADIDNDGDLDLMFQGGNAENLPGARQLFRNNIIGTGSMTYTNISNDSLPDGLGPSWSAAWSDYDGDGNIDMFVGQSNIGATGDVLKNDGTGTFTNESVATGLDDPGFHQNLAWIDIDNDRDLDLIMAMEGPEKHEIYLQGPGGSFTPVGAAVGFQEDFGTKAYGMAIGDTDGDGDLDIYISTCHGTGTIRNNFYQNMLVETGSLGFVDLLAGTDDNGTQFMQNSYGSEFLDFDDDGDLDLFFHDHKVHSGNDNARKLYRNDGNWEFTDVTAAEGLYATNEGSYDSAWADIDMDGDQDLIATTDDDFDERVFVSNATNNHLQTNNIRVNDNNILVRRSNQPFSEPSWYSMNLFSNGMNRLSKDVRWVNSERSHWA